jgi:hypothetical protein
MVEKVGQTRDRVALNYCLPPFLGLKESDEKNVGGEEREGKRRTKKIDGVRAALSRRKDS